MDRGHRGKVVVLKTGSTVPEVRHRGDFEDWIRDGLAGPIDVVDADSASSFPAIETLGAIVVTGSPASVTEQATWMKQAGRWLAASVDRDVPVLGICFGHQLLADALGGRVVRNPRGREIGTVKLSMLASAASDPLLSVLGADEVLAHASHSDTVQELPAGAIRLATSALDECQAFRVRADRRAWGVQFHPEFDADITRGYIRARAELMRGEGLDPEAHTKRTVDTDTGPRVFARFREIVGD